MPRRSSRESLQHELKKRRAFVLAEVEAFLNMQRTASMLSRQAESLLKAHGLTEAQYNVLRILRGAKYSGDVALPSLEVASRLVTPVPDITRLVDRLEIAGLVERRSQPGDRRVVLVAITIAGLGVLSQLDKPVDDMHRRQLGHLSPGELDKLNHLLVKARQAPLPSGRPTRSPSRGTTPPQPNRPDRRRGKT